MSGAIPTIAEAARLQRPLRTTGNDRRLGGARVGQGPLLGHVHKGVQLAVELVHVIETGACQLNGRELLCRDQVYLNGYYLN